jgi:sterol desaturase/sphingolipid hydroxylase (fatty acid hydroxylase superfamily)
VLEILRLSALLILMVALFGTLERVWGLHTSKLFRKAFGTDLAYYFLNALSSKLLLIVPLAVLSAFAHHMFAGRLYGTVGSWPMGLRLAAAAVVSDVGAYWGHRWSHEIPWLWRFHAVHHSAEELDWLVNSRAHPLDIVFTRLCGYVPMYVLGLAQPMAGSQMDLVPVLVAFVGTLWGFFVHANLRWRFGFFEWLVSTPAFHHWHHVKTTPINKNYAALLPWVDGMFGTLYMPRHEWPSDYGTETQVAEGLQGQLLQPFSAQDAPSVAEQIRTA